MWSGFHRPDVTKVLQHLCKMTSKWILEFINKPFNPKWQIWFLAGVDWEDHCYCRTRLWPWVSYSDTGAVSDRHEKVKRNASHKDWWWSGVRDVILSRLWRYQRVKRSHWINIKVLKRGSAERKQHRSATALRTVDCQPRQVLSHQQNSVWSARGCGLARRSTAPEGKGTRERDLFYSILF